MTKRGGRGGNTQDEHAIYILFGSNVLMIQHGQIVRRTSGSCRLYNQMSVIYSSFYHVTITWRMTSYIKQIQYSGRHILLITISNKMSLLASNVFLWVNDSNEHIVNTARASRGTLK